MIPVNGWSEIVTLCQSHRLLQFTVALYTVVHKWENTRNTGRKSVYIIYIYDHICFITGIYISRTSLWNILVSRFGHVMVTLTYTDIHWQGLWSFIDLLLYCWLPSNASGNVFSYMFVLCCWPAPKPSKIKANDALSAWAAMKKNVECVPKSGGTWGNLLLRYQHGP